jgi:alpha-tubulin N-acetyltransferase 1
MNENSSSTKRFTFLTVTSSSIHAQLSAECCTQLDNLGIKSGQAQLLNGPITSVEKLAGSNHTIIVCRSTDGDNVGIGCCVGYLKYGVKDLYFYHKNGKVIQSSPVCLLDFYVDDSMQRNGLGLSLFRHMLDALSIDPPVSSSTTPITPKDIAYDRPSPKLIAFMRKHYNMLNPDLQPNRFAIYDGFTLG